MRRVLGNVLLSVGGAGVAGIGLLHLAWGAGWNWPAESRVELAQVVTGGDDFPSKTACVVVAAPLLVAGASALAIALGRCGQEQGKLIREFPSLVVLTAGAALSARGIAGGEIACKVVGLGEPNAEFLRMDQSVYRPLTLSLGASLVLGRLLRGSRSTS